MAPSFAYAQDASSPPDQGGGQTGQRDEIVVTGTRIVTGFKAPTPLTVVGTEALQAAPQSNVAQQLVTMPVFSGSSTTANNGNGSSAQTSGTSVLNLRNMGSTRTLILIDGQRSVGSLLDGSVDINTIPQQLVKRVDVVTGGASAVYGSDAVSGVVNFVLDRDFKGFKAEVSGGATNYGDNKNYKITATAGFSFGDDRGHLLFSGEHVEKAGIVDALGGRPWGANSPAQVNNPAYTPTNGQPKLLVRDHVGISNATLGGIIVKGPGSLTGIAFGEGGVPYRLNQGTTLVTDVNFVGGDYLSTIPGWTERGSSLDTKENRLSLFARASYDLTDHLNVFAQASVARSKTFSHCCGIYFPGNAAVVGADNPFMPATIRAALLDPAQGGGPNAKVTIGSNNGDLEINAPRNVRTAERLVAGANGDFDAIGTNWKWDAYYQFGRSISVLQATGTISRRNYALAVDAVVDPKTGAVVCRSTLTNPTNGCVPYNVFGTGVNSQSAVDYIEGKTSYPMLSYLRQVLTQNVWAASVTGSPINLPAGPLSIALSGEHRTESVSGRNDPNSETNDWHTGNYYSTTGSYNVTEGALELLVPLFEGKRWAESWNLSAAARATHYSTSGNVVTWKIGTTYTPVNGVMFRVTRSRDIRAPNLSELYKRGGGASGNTFDPFTNTTVPVRSFSTGNLNLKPEKADTWGVGVVLQPAFLRGFSVSVDYWAITLNGMIAQVSNANIIDQCFRGVSSFCDQVERRNGVLYQIDAYPINFGVQRTRGIDFALGYRKSLSDFVDSWKGTVSLTTSVTKYLESYTDNRISLPTDTVGQNIDGAPPYWNLTSTVTYNLDPLTVSLTGRARSRGTIDNSYIVCTSGCPADTQDHRTIDYNTMPGFFYLDASVSWKFRNGLTAFANASNILNRDPAGFPNLTPLYIVPTQRGVYDTMGTIFRVGVRYQM